MRDHDQALDEDLLHITVSPHFLYLNASCLSVSLAVCHLSVHVVKTWKHWTIIWTLFDWIANENFKKWKASKVNMQLPTFIRLMEFKEKEIFEICFEISSSKFYGSTAVQNLMLLSKCIPCLAFQILVYKITIKTCSIDLCYFMTLWTFSFLIFTRSFLIYIELINLNNEKLDCLILYFILQIACW